MDPDQPTWKQFVRTLLLNTALSEAFRTQLLRDEQCQRWFEEAFTHPSLDAENNYECYEILGDATVNKCIIWYIYHRFPQLQNCHGVKVIARLRINLVSRAFLSLLAEKLQLQLYIKIQQPVLASKMKTILEDVFEAFLGALELSVDRIAQRRRSCQTGYQICFRIMKRLLDTISISLQYESLFDPVTRLKETMDYLRTHSEEKHLPEGCIQSITYETQRLASFQTEICVYANVEDSKILLARTTGGVQDEVRQEAASQALMYLAEKGLEKPIPRYYLELDQSHTQEIIKTD